MDLLELRRKKEKIMDDFEEEIIPEDLEYVRFDESDLPRYIFWSPSEQKRILLLRRITPELPMKNLLSNYRGHREYWRFGWTYDALLNVLGHGSFYAALGITWREYQFKQLAVYFWE